MRRPASAIVALLLSVVLLATVLAGCAPAVPSEAEGPGPMAAPDHSGEKIVFADVSWDASTFMCDLAAFITREGYGYDAEVTVAANMVALKSIESGDIDVHMDVEYLSIGAVYDEVVASGKGEALGVSYTPVWQGWLVPTYMIEGDAERGIEATMPGVKTVFDLGEHWELFKDPEDPKKGRFLGCVPGWQCEETNRLKIEAYGLDETFNVVSPGSDAALSASMVSAYEKGESWFGYYWTPTWVMGKVEMTQLEEPAYDADLWTEEAKFACAFPDDVGQIVGATSLQQRAPEVREFLIKFNIPIEAMNELLLYLKESGKSAAEATPWFLTRYEDVWTQWVPADVAERVKAAAK